MLVQWLGKMGIYELPVKESFAHQSSGKPKVQEVVVVEGPCAHTQTYTLVA